MEEESSFGQEQPPAGARSAEGSGETMSRGGNPKSRVGSAPTYGSGNVCENDIAIIHYRASAVDDGTGEVAAESGRMRLRAGDCGAVGGIDTAVVGMGIGESKKLVSPPEHAFGERDPSLITTLPRSRFRQYPDLKTGSLITLCSKSGEEIEVVTRKVSGESVIVDANHPLAGMTLNFDMTVLAIESARRPRGK